MDKNFEVNGNYVVCSLFEEQDSASKVKGIELFNKIEEGFQKINRFKIEEIVGKEVAGFPFEVGDVVVVCSSGTTVSWKGMKRWLFQPEHVLARIGK